MELLNICRKARPEEYEDIIDFINYVFSQNQCPHDFKKLLPKLYGDGRNYAEYHYLIEEAGRIKALVCAMPLEYGIHTEVLKACCIGMVSVHPYARGKGYMKQLMNYVLEDVKSQGFHYIFLGGQRQRYEYFGFEPSGMMAEFTVTATNVRHLLQGIDAKEVGIVPLENEEQLNQAYSLYQSQPVKALRSREDFYDILSSWQSTPYGIILKNEYAGTLVLRPDGAVTELMLSSGDYYPYVLKALFSLTGKEEHKFPAAPFEEEKLDFLMQIAEYSNISTCESYRILDWKSVLLTLLRLKAAGEPLAEGTLVLAVGQDKIKIEVKDNIVAVHMDKEEEDIFLTSLNATALLFSHRGILGLHRLTAGLSEQKRNCVKSWFPLPLTAMANDCC